MTRGLAIILITLVLLLLSVTIGLSSQLGKSLLCDEVIAFQSIRDGNYEIYLLDVDTGFLVNLTQHSAQDSYPSWSPDGELLAFASDRNGNHEIYTVDSSGKEIHNLTQNPAYDSFPVWSPDGMQLAFVSDRSGNQDVFIMNADGSNSRNITQNPSFDGYPAWSVDGRRLAFASQRTGDNEIYEVVLESLLILQLSNEAYFEYYGSHSAQGELAFGSDLYEPFPEIYVRETNGNIRRLTYEPGYDLGPVWSPDGRRIAFVSTRSGNEDIYLMDANGDILRQLTDSPYPDTWISWRPCDSV